LQLAIWRLERKLGYAFTAGINLVGIDDNIVALRLKLLDCGSSLP
jgi:hypothetical protein